MNKKSYYKDVLISGTCIGFIFSIISTIFFQSNFSVLDVMYHCLSFIIAIIFVDWVKGAKIFAKPTA